MSAFRDRDWRRRQPRDNGNGPLSDAASHTRVSRSPWGEGARQVTAEGTASSRPTTAGEGGDGERERDEHDPHEEGKPHPRFRAEE